MAITTREYKLAGDAYITQAGQVRREVLEFVDGHRRVILVVSNDDAVDVLEVLRRAYTDGREDRGSEDAPGHYHDATGHEDTLCQCPSPGTYAPQWPAQHINQDKLDSQLEYLPDPAAITEGNRQ